VIPRSMKRCFGSRRSRSLARRWWRSAAPWTGGRMDETVRSIRTALVDAIAGEHRLRRQGLEQKREAEHWEQRSSLADTRGLADLAAEARQRAERHRRTAALHEQRATEMRIQVERLRGALAAAQGHGRAPPVGGASLEAQFSALELDRELERIRASRSLPATSNRPGQTDPEPQGG
jgi:phage shock protein A